MMPLRVASRHHESDGDPVIGEADPDSSLKVRKQTVVTRYGRDV